LFTQLTIQALKMGIVGFLLTVLTSYLENGTYQRKHSWRILYEFGVPQDSVFGPLGPIFLHNDIFDSIHSSIFLPTIQVCNFPPSSQAAYTKFCQKIF